MLGLVVAVVAELITPLDDVLGCCHGREGKKEQGQKKKSFHCLFSIQSFKRSRSVLLSSAGAIASPPARNKSAVTCRAWGLVNSR